MSEWEESGFTRGVTQAVLQAETNDGRFENFSREVVSLVEGGAPILSTSLSWDLGRDGVGAGVARGIYVCCSLRDDVDAKALADITRISATTKNIQRLYFCSSHSLSEHRKDKIEQVLQAETDYKFPVTCFGGLQLAELAFGDSKILQRFYGAEIDDCVKAIKKDPSNDDEVRGLRLALISATGDDSHSIRVSVYRAALLDVLSDGAKKTLVVCSNQLSANLRLGRSIAAHVLRPHLDDLCLSGEVGRDSVGYFITEKGQTEIKRQELDAADRLIEGRKAIRAALEKAIDSAILDDHFSVIWSVLEERMSHYFNHRGEIIVAEVGSFIGERSAEDLSSGDAPIKKGSFSFLEELSRAVGATSSNAQRAEELYQAVKDMFADRKGPAADWLVRLSASFVAACALGLEHSSGRALAKLMSRTNLVLDTDVVLSLIGEGEPEHDAAEAIVSRWLDNGGTVLIGEPVLEEVAYHASIADLDFDQVRQMLPGTPEDRLHLIENVFVRSFAELIARDTAHVRQWRQYIGQYKGTLPRDWKNVFATIAADFPVKKLPARSTEEAELEGNVRDFLLDQAAQKSGNVTFNTRDKARRDAELYAALVHHLRSIRAADPGATCLMVSSARRLASAESFFKETGEVQLIISISATLYLLSLLPDVSLGLSAMKAFLFEDRRPGFSSDLERTLLRMVRSSNEVSMPFAKRGLLMRSIRERMVRDAQARGHADPSNAEINGMEKSALTPVNRPRTIEILRDALDSVVVSTRVERENSDLKARIRELEARLAQRPSSR